ncbi:MAG: lactonase family protein [Spirochaetaceae bacterium]|jgi:6-phosphogluconolactonase|nr:lactonase family protein [Spirochaetaceae bacterium]
MSVKQIAYVGAWGADIQGVTNPGEGDGGVKVYTIAENGAMELRDQATPQVNAGCISISADGRFLYAADERKDFGGVYGNGGGVCAYRIDRRTGKLSFINEVSSAGAYPCYITVDRNRRYAFVSNHGNHEEATTQGVRTERGTYIAKRMFDEGSIAVFPLSEDGSLKECCELKVLEGNSVLDFFQWTAHPHSVFLDNAEQFLFTADKGSDLIRVYRIDYDRGRLEEAWEQRTQKGSAPRHLVFHPVLPVLYCNSEQNNTVHAYRFERETGKLEHMDSAVTVPEHYAPSNTGDTFDRNQTADIRIHKSGQFLYVSNRGHNSVAVFTLNDRGNMTRAGIVPSGGEIPRAMNFDIPGNALYVANQRTGNIVQFVVDDRTGLPRQTGYEIKLKNPVSLQFLALP